MGNGYDVISRIVEGYRCEDIQRRPCSPEEVDYYDPSGKSVRDFLENIRRYRRHSEEVEIGPVCDSLYSSSQTPLSVT
ncbi:hypothetical protein HOE04_01090 [archaeon]|nr:hypothetical protein [archaeon]